MGCQGFHRHLEIWGFRLYWMRGDVCAYIISSVGHLTWIHNSFRFARVSSERLLDFCTVGWHDFLSLLQISGFLVFSVNVVVYISSVSSVGLTTSIHNGFRSAFDSSISTLWFFFSGYHIILNLLQNSGFLLFIVRVAFHISFTSPVGHITSICNCFRWASVSFLWTMIFCSDRYHIFPSLL